MKELRLQGQTRRMNMKRSMNNKIISKLFGDIVMINRRKNHAGSLEFHIKV